MKHNLLKSVIISVILLMGVSNAWAVDHTGGDIYFLKPSTWTESKVMMFIGHDSYTAVYEMTKVSNTDNLYHYAMPSWGGATYVAFANDSYVWGTGNWGPSNRTNAKHYTNVYNNYRFDSGSYYVIVPASTSNNAGITINYTGTTVSSVNRTTKAIASNKAHGTVSVSGYYMSSYKTTASTRSAVSSTASNATASTTLAPASTITFNATANSGYDFIGWYDAESGGNQLSTSTTYTVKYDISFAEKTVYARFEKTYAVTISAGANGTVSPTGSQQVGSTNVTIKATANTGYKFKNWTKTGGVVIANANNATTTITATANGTVTANFEEDLTSTWHIVGDPTSIFKGTSTWTAHNDNMLKKTTGASTAYKGSLTIDVKTLPANNDSYQFKVLNTNGTKWYGWSNETNNHFWVNQTITTGVYNADNNNLYFIPNALGEYKFAVDWSSSNPSLTVTFPTAYAVTFGKGTGCSSVTAKYNGTSFNSGTKVQQGKTVTFTQSASTGYTFKEWNTKADGTGTKLSAEATYTHTVTTSNNVYAVYTQNPDRTIYLEPTGFWNSNNPQYVAHVWGSGDEDITMTGVGEAPYRYYTCEVPAKYTNILFYRKSTNGSTIWNQTADLALPNKSTALYEIKSTGDKTPGQDGYSAATGVWKEANLVYTITLGYCDFGTYGIKYNGQSYFSKPKNNVTIDVPAGAQIEILEGQPHSNAYTGDVIKSTPTKVELTIGQTLTINGDITLDDNFKTKTSHVVYLGVPDGLTDWTSGTYGNFLWSWNTMSSFSLIASTRNFKIDNTTYYEYTIPAGRHSLCFQRKTGVNDNGTPQKESVYLPFHIPLTNVNCFTLNEKDGSRYKGDWSVLPAQTGDYRILYVEQTVEYGEIRFDKSHPSDIVKLTNTGDKAIVSLHLYNKRAGGVNGTNNAAVILQRCTGYDAGVAQWEEIEYHMVYNYLFSDASAALLPGRRNTVELQVHDGLEVIKAVADSEEHDYGSGVWNFTVKKTEESATLLLDEEHLKPYEGNYYIRTSNTEGGWVNYSIPANYMTFSSYAKKHSDFSHYFCRWVNVSNDSPNVKFVVANDYGTNISKELAGDEIIGKGTSNLPANANVRWQWNMVTNEVKRAYIDGATANNITVTKNTANPVKLDDAGNWIYRTDLANIAPGDKITAITANYNGKSQTLLENTYQTDGMPMLEGDGTGYSVRVRYDFKINETKVYLIPNGTTDVTTNIDVLIERTNQGDAQQVSKAIKAVDKENGYTVYAVMSFTKSHIEGSGTQSEKLYYWVSFPFDVRISDVFGFGEYGVHWIMEYYDGAERAKNGAWIDSPTYWRYITDTTSVDIPDDNKNLNCGILKANQGYVLALALNIANMGIFTNTDKVSLYFPSMSPITTQIDGGIIETTVKLDEYECTIERDNRRIHDSNWHIIGVPSFSDKQQTLTQDNLLYFYTRDQQDDTYIPTSTKGSSITFKSLHSYMVQYAGTINWAAEWKLSQPQGLAAKRNSNEEKTHSLRLELSQNGTYNDQTLVTLQEEGATEAFDMNLDLSKMMNAGNNIYTLAGEELIQVAGNSLPIANTVIPVGVQIAKAGEYTFAMPDGTDGITVELIDYETNIRTNLMLDEYTVDLAAGTNEARFALHVKPSKVTTSIDPVLGENGQVRKILMNGQLYLLKDGQLYDAQGRCVQ